MSVSVVSSFMHQCWSLKRVCVCSKIYVQDCMHTHACAPGTRLTLLLDPVRLGFMWSDLWYAGVQPGAHGYKSVHISGQEPMEGGSTGIKLVYLWKYKCRDLSCGPM